MRRTLLFFIVAAFVCATTERSARARTIIEASDSQVATCKPLGQVTGSSGLGGVAMWSGVKDAQNAALEAAAAVGATHIVWSAPTMTQEAQFVSGIAYRCES